MAEPKVVWECTLHGVVGYDRPSAEEHIDHPAGWKLEGNQHPKIDRFDPEHPDKVKGFCWLR